jgi:hypothetical protein
MRELKEEPWSLLFENLHIGGLRDHTDLKPMFQLFAQVNDLPALQINITANTSWNKCSLGFKPRTYKTKSQRAHDLPKLTNALSWTKLFFWGKNVN